MKGEKGGGAYRDVVKWIPSSLSSCLVKSWWLIASSCGRWLYPVNSKGCNLETQQLIVLAHREVSIVRPHYLLSQQKPACLFGMMAGPGCDAML